jgi:HD superfamily phosphohydrolase
MQQCISHLRQEYFEQFKPRQLNEEALQAAALLHDIGHSPLSHATEKIFGNHEKKAVEIINSSDSEVHKVLTKRASSLPSKISALISKKGVAPLWQKSLISSQLDMDRLDYLRRDSLNSGAEYGNFDWFRIIRTMQLEEKDKEIFIVWPDKTKYALEEYIFSRFYMYQSVYFHHTTRGFEGLLRRILRYAQNVAKKDKSFAKELLPPMKTLIGGKQSQDPSRFQNLIDHVLLAQIIMWQSHKDKTLSDLARRLIKRRGIGWEEITENITSFEMTGKVNAVREYLRQKGFDPVYYFFEDVPKATIYEPYRPAAEVDDQSSVNSIMLYDSSWKPTGFKEISDCLERLQAITVGKLSPIFRYYFPKEHEKQIKKLLS